MNCDLADLPDPGKRLGDTFRKRIPDADHDVLEHDRKAERSHESVIWAIERELEQTSLEQKPDKADDGDGDENSRNVAETVAHQNPDADRA